MARSELDKLLAATHGNGGTGGGRSNFIRLLAEVVNLSRAPKVGPAAGAAPPRLTQGKTIHPEATNNARLLKAAPAIQAVVGAAVTGASDVGRLAAQVDQLQRSMTPPSNPVAVHTKASSVSRGSASTSTGTRSGGLVKVLSHFLSGSALGSIVTGIAGLFGGGKPAAPVPLYRFDLPKSVSVEAGVTRSGQFVPVNHVQSGQVRPNETPQTVTQAAPQSIIADTRWFMDHSEDIASAVKEAMLHSHSINDVVADL